MLTDLAGTRPVTEIADELERRFYIRRTTASLRDLERIFGTAHHTILPRWVEPGHLAGRRWQGRGPNLGWWFEHAEVERFVRETDWLYHLDKMQRGHKLTRLAEIVHRSDPWIVGTAAVAEVLGLATVQVKKWMGRGLIPHHRRPWGGGPGMVVVRGRDIPAIKAAIHEAQRASIEEGRERFSARQRLRSQRALVHTLANADRLIGACKNGHPRTIETTRVGSNGRLACLACRAERISLGKAG